MKLLFAIPHYYNPINRGSRGYGAHSGRDELRLQAVRTCLQSIQQLFGRPQCVIDIARRTTTPANQVTATVADVVLCTTGSAHLLDRLELSRQYYTPCPTTAEPLLLGFACHAALRDRLGAYDFYCYLEDDLVLRDPWFFVKLRWFVNNVGPDSVLMPNRYEIGHEQIVHKAYVDGPLKEKATAAYQDIADRPEIIGEVLGQRVRFARPLNPHSGCFFLTAEQFTRWTTSGHFLDGATSFIGPLESAATLGVMRTFRVYKPTMPTGAFLEIEHFVPAFLPLIRPREADRT